MTNETAFIDRIVTAVMEQLQTEAVSIRADKTIAERAVNKNQTTLQSANAVIDDRVITADTLASKTNGRTTIRIVRSSLLTPSARDYLRAHGISVEWPVTDSTQAASAGHWAAIVVSKTAVVEQAVDDLTRTGGVEMARQLVGTIKEAVETAVSGLCRAETAGVVIFASNPERVVCLANRNCRIRAAAVADIQALKSARCQIGANLICIDPEGRSYFELRRLLQELTTGEPPQVPDGWPE